MMSEEKRLDVTDGTSQDMRKDKEDLSRTSSKGRTVAESDRSRGALPDVQRAPKGTMKRLVGYIMKYRWRVAAIVVCILICACTQSLPSLVLQPLIDNCIMPFVGSANPDWRPLINMTLVVGCIYFVGMICSFTWNYMVVGVEQGVLKTIRDQMFEHQQHLPIRYFDTHEHGDMMSRYTNDTDTLRQAISQSLPQILISSASAVAALTAMLWLSVPLTVFTVVFLVIMMLVVRVIIRRSGLYFVKRQETLGEVNAFVEENVGGQKVIKVFNHENATAAEFDKKNEELFRANAAANTYANVTMPVIGNMGNLLYVLLAIVGGVAGICGWHNFGFSGSGVFTLGAIVSFLTLSKTLINPVSQISSQFNMIMMALAGASRIFKLMDEPVENDDGSVSLVRVRVGEDGRTMTEVSQDDVDCDRHGYASYQWAWKRAADDDGSRSLKAAEKLQGQAREVAIKAHEKAVTSPDGRYTLLRGDVRFTNVSFGYNPDKTVLHDITWFAKPGQKMALVGATGAGKTTITNLINRFYDIQEGQILYDGIDVRNIRKADLRRSLGIVLQDVNLFTGTVIDNIRYGRLNATDEECINAAKLTNADGFIRMLPQGYDTVLAGDGSGLSQGQRQLVSIARAAVADPPAMILDEATSSIDTRTEEVVQEGMDALMKGRTVFVIAHRLSTVRNSDVIMVLDHGNIIERGTHDELIAQKGEYYQLYTGKLELE